MKEIVIEIGCPFWTQEEEEAACPVAIRGLLGRVQDIRGADPMSAMKFAIRFVESCLKPHPGEKLFWMSGEEFTGDGSP
jgi:hypothetical protein